MSDAGGERRLPRLYTIVVFTMTLVFFSSYPTNGSYLGIGLSLGWLWILILAAVTFPMNLTLIRSDQRITTAPILLWAAAFMGIALLWHFFAPSPADSMLALQAYGWFMLTLVFAFTMLRTAEARRIAIEAVKWVIGGSAIVNVVMAAAGTYRPGGIYGNPNASGYALVMGMIISYASIPPRWRFPFQVLMLIGVFATASRGALMLWGLSSVLLYVLNRERGTTTRWAVVSVAVIFLVMISPAGDSMLRQVSGGDTGDQFDRLFSLGSKSELEGDERVTLAEMAIDHVKHHFLFGAGTGQATVRYDDIDYGPHNMFLALMMQFGVIGFFIMPALALILIGRDPQRWKFSIPFAMLVMVACMFDHNMLDQWHYAFAYALVARLQGTEYGIWSSESIRQGAARHLTPAYR